jgi:hypothetical protein
LCILKVSVLKPFDHVEELASIGVGGLVLCRMFTYSSGSYTNPKEVSWTAGLKGLNWQVQVDPLSFTMVSLPPTFVLDEEELLLPPQPAMSTHTATSDVSETRRFIDILRSTSEIASGSLAENSRGVKRAPPVEPMAHC